MRRKLRKAARSVEMKKISEIENAGIFFDASSADCRMAAKNFMKDLKSKDIQTWSLGYFDTKNPEEDFISDKNVYFSTLKDFSFFFLPKSDEVKEFISRKTGILVVFSMNDPFPAEAVVKMSCAHLKVGITNTFNNAMDLTFEINADEAGKLTDQIHRYL